MAVDDEIDEVGSQRRWTRKKTSGRRTAPSKILELLKSWLLAQEVDNEVDDPNVSGQWSRKI